MPKTLYTEDGEKIENVPTEDEVKEMNDKIGKMETELKEKGELLAKLNEKDLNFSALRNANKEDREKILKDYSKKEQAMISQMEGMQKQIDDYHSGIMQSYENEVLSQLAGNDEERRKKIIETAKTFVGEAKTREDLQTRYSNAAKLIGGTATNPLNSFVPSVGYSAPKGTKYTETEEGKQNLGRWFPNVPGFKPKK